MSGYIGPQPVPQATQHREAFTATASQTSFATAGYTPQFLDVYLNGVKLAAADYTATNGSDIVLTTGAALDDILEYVAYTPFEVASQTFTGTTTLTDSGAAPLVANRTTSDGDITVFQKDGATVGSIGSSNSDLTIGNSDVGLKFHDANNTIYPWNVSTDLPSDGLIDVGATIARVKDIYTSGAIYLGGTVSANALDDYEEGTWTPTYAGTTTAGTYTYSEQQGHYIKVGNQVTIWFNLTNITDSTSGAGNVKITGLPFTAGWQAGFNGEGLGHIIANGFTSLDGDTVWGAILSNEMPINYQTGANNQGATLALSAKVDGDSDLRGFATYVTA